MAGSQKKTVDKERKELLGYLRKLAKWRNNDVVKLAMLSPDNMDFIDQLDLSGVVELKRNANGTFEAKFIDPVRVLAMLRELMDDKKDNGLEDFMDALKQPEDGDAS